MVPHVERPHPSHLHTAARQLRAGRVPPQHPGVPPKNCIPELERLAQLGFVGVNLNPDPAGGYWTDPPLTDRWWYPLYEKLSASSR